jgi:hypothetical protein
VIRRVAPWFAGLLLVVSGSPPATPQGTPTAPAPPSGSAPVPWKVGEYLEYSVKWGVLHAGSGRMQVTALDTVRGRDVWHLDFNVTGGTLFIRVDDTFESWMDVATLNSLRFVQDLSELGGHVVRRYEIFPDRQVFSKNGQDEQRSVAGPLDDASFFFFVRTIPLEIDSTYVLPRYFDPKGNPVTIRVLRRDTIQVEAGRFATIVVQPSIKTGGLFSDGHAELWLSDDNRRILVQMKARLAVGTLNLYLRKMRNTQSVSAAPERPR